MLRYAAGRRALRRLAERGLGPGDVRALALPAVGPKWLVAAGFDRALIRSGLLRRPDGKVLLVGASAGAWRGLTLASRDPIRTQGAFLEAYVTQHFTRRDDRRSISAAYRRMIGTVFSDGDLGHALSHPSLALAITTVRARGPCGSGVRALQTAGFGAAALLNAFHARATGALFERVVFHSDLDGGAPRLAGTHVRLTEDNVRDAALATGTVPLYMQPIRDIAGAAPGAYLDGGLTDYHLGQRLEARDGIVLLFLHQRRIIPRWLDKMVPWRSPGRGALDDVLLVYPDDDFVRGLPGGVVPTREDFHDLVDRPAERMERWRTAARRSEALGERFLEDLKGGTLAQRARPLGG